MSDRPPETSGPAGTGLPSTPGGGGTTLEPVPAVSEPTPEAPRRTVDELAAFIVGQAGRPIDVWAIAALLESSGIRDVDAVDEFGRRDVFALAQAVQVRLPEAAAGAGAERPARPPMKERARRLARLLGRGSFFFVPLGLQFATLLIFGISQFAYLRWSTYDASLVAAPVGIAFIVTGGFIQAMGYLGPVFEEPGKHMLTRRVVAGVLAVGIGAAALIGLALWGISALTDAYPPGAIRIALAYYILTAVQSLINAVLYMLHRYVLMAATTVAGLVVVVLLHRHTSWTIAQQHWVGLGFLILLQLGVVLTLLGVRAGRTKGAMRFAVLPRRRLLARRATPFWVYGSVYFAYLLVDRLVAWAAGSHALPLWFRTTYELGLDWALFGVVLALAFLEVVVEDFSETLIPIGDRFRVDAVRDHNRTLARFWARRLAGVGILAALGAWSAIVLAVLLQKAGLLGAASQEYADHSTRVAFAGGIIGYALLALGVGNSVFLMSLARPWQVISAIVPGLAVSIGMGILLTTNGPYWNAVWGMVLGSGVFALISGVQTSRALRRADYHTYAAF